LVSAAKGFVLCQKADLFNGALLVLAWLMRETPPVPVSENPLAAEPFSHQTSKSGVVFIAYHGREIKTLRDGAAASFLARMALATDHMAEQMLMAKATGNFKRGNERLSKH
jgi:hypothetical protein